MPPGDVTTKKGSSWRGVVAIKNLSTKTRRTRRLAKIFEKMIEILSEKGKSWDSDAKTDDAGYMIYEI
jgi:hypothetical protein